MTRLKKQGLRGLEVKSACEGRFSRHPHPKEVGFLMGIPPFAKALKSKRLELALIGNMISPIQVVWLFAELRRVGLLHGSSESQAPTSEDLLIKYLNMLRWQKHISWPENTLEEDAVCTVMDENGSKQVKFKEHSTIKMLKEAELADYQIGTMLQAKIDGIEVPDHLPLKQLTYSLSLRRKCQAKLEGSPLLLKLLNEQGEEIHMVEFGSSLAMLFQHLDRRPTFRCFDEEEQIIGWHQKLLRSCVIRLCPIFFASGDEDDREEEDEFPFEVEDGNEWQEDCSSEFQAVIHRVAVSLKDEVDNIYFASAQGGGLDSHTMETACKGIISMVEEERRRSIGLITPTLVKDFLESDRTVVCESIMKLVQQENVKEFFVIGAFQNHWQVFHLRWSQKELFVVISDARENMMGKTLDDFLRPFQMALGVEKITVSKDNVLIQGPDKICGAIALMHLAYLLGLLASAKYEEVSNWYLLLRWRHGQPFRAQGNDVEDLREWLVSLLPEKGVPNGKVEARAADAVKSLSLSELKRAKDSSNPWKIMKGLTDKKGKTFRWVLQDELQQHIDQKAQSGFGVEGRRKPKNLKNDEPTGGTSQFVDPSTVMLKTGSFVDSKGADLPILDILQVKVNARGIALAASADLKAWLMAGKSISLSALALVTTSVIPEDLQRCLPHSCIRFPVILKASGDPMLLTGSLVQLGDEHVSKRSTVGAPVISTSPTAALKIHVYRDEWQRDWSIFCAKPVSQLQELFPQLQACNGKACGLDCCKWHQDVDGTYESPILDVWSWFWQRKEGGKTKAKDAFVFTVMMRVPEDHSPVLQPLSGLEGVYFEPRDPTGRQTDDNFAVVWLGRCEKADAQVHVRSMEKVRALCRLKDRYGLRVKIEDEEDVFGSLFPQRIYVPCKPTDIYVMEPLPFGIQKFGVAKLIKDLHWAAKPMQPKGSSSGSLAWLVAAQTPPPENVLLTDTGEVMITWLRSLAPKKREVDNVIASWETKKKLHEKADPWLGNQDPWAKYKNAQTPAQQPTPVRMDQDDQVTKKLDNLQDQLKQQITKEIQATLPVALQAHSERVDRMEVDLCEMRLQGEQFQRWFKEQGEM